MESISNSTKRTARMAGVLYLIWIIAGLYSIMYVPSRTFVDGDAMATANKILANEFLFRTAIINDLFSSVIWVLIGMTLYKLFKQVQEHQARLLVALVIVQVPVVFFMEALNITSLMIFKDKILTTFEVAQRQDLAMLFLKINSHTSIALEIYWGLWLIPFGQLVYKSGFIPRILGIFLILNGIAFFVHFTTHLLLPNYQAMVFKLATPFWILGEISIMLWLLIKGVRDVPDTRTSV